MKAIQMSETTYKVSAKFETTGDQLVGRESESRGEVIMILEALDYDVPSMLRKLDTKGKIKVNDDDTIIVITANR